MNKRAEIKRKAREAELDYVKARLHPEDWAKFIHDLSSLSDRWFANGGTINWMDYKKLPVS